MQEIINVITIRNGVVNDIESFIVYDTDLSDEEIEVANELERKSVKVAEDYFKTKVCEMSGHKWDEEEFNNLLDDGLYHPNYSGRDSVCICWTQI